MCERRFPRSLKRTLEPLKLELQLAASLWVDVEAGATVGCEPLGGCGELGSV